MSPTPLADQIAELEHRLMDLHDMPRIAQVLHEDERRAIENQLADLRQRRDQGPTAA